MKNESGLRVPVCIDTSRSTVVNLSGEVHLCAMLIFNERGLLTPPKGLSVTVAEVEKAFVRPFPDSDTRAWLFNSLQVYNRDLGREIKVPFRQYIDGSFVTHKLNPNDIDLVTFIPTPVFERHRAGLEGFWGYYWGRMGLDAYLVEVFPAGHLRHEESLRDRKIWRDRYGFTKPDANFGQFRKGYVILDTE